MLLLCFARRGLFAYKLPGTRPKFHPAWRFGFLDATLTSVVSPLLLLLKTRRKKKLQRSIWLQLPTWRNGESVTRLTYLTLRKNSFSVLWAWCFYSWSKHHPFSFTSYFFVLFLLSLMMDEFGRRCVNLDAIFGRPVCWYYGREKTIYSYLIPSLVFIFPSQGQVGEHAQDRPLRNYQHDAQRHHRRLRSEVCKNKKQINSLS